MEGLGYLVFEDPTRAVEAAAALRYFAKGFEVADDAPVEMAPVTRASLVAAGAGAAGASDLLREIGVPDVETVSVSGEETAVNAAAGSGFPLPSRSILPTSPTRRRSAASISVSRTPMRSARPGAR